MKVLAIDPGYGRCGVAVLERNGGEREVLLFSDCIETSAKAEFPERLALISRKCARLMEEFTPDAVVLEKLFFTTNQKTGMHVAEVRGALIGEASRLQIPLFEYTPGEVKSATAGSGSADKKQVATMLHVLIKIEKKIKHDDEYDAIAVGITHLARHRS